MEQEPERSATLAKETQYHTHSTEGSFRASARSWVLG
jgi:hypothetical protein